MKFWGILLEFRAVNLKGVEISFFSFILHFLCSNGEPFYKTKNICHPCHLPIKIYSKFPLKIMNQMRASGATLFG